MSPDIATVPIKPVPGVALVAYACDPDAGSEPLNGWKWMESLAAARVTTSLYTRPRAVDRILQRLEADGLDSARVEVIDETRRWHRVLPRRARMYVEYLTFLRRTERRIRRVEPANAIVHHVTWGSANLGTVRVGAHQRLLWGPVGGGQTTDSEMRLLFRSHWWWEVLRTWLATTISRWMPGTRAGVKMGACALATNLQTVSVMRRWGYKDVSVVLADAVDDVPPFNPGSTCELLWVGRMLPIKGAPVALEIFSELIKLIPQARLTMVGDGPEFEVVQDMCRELGLEEHVTLTGRIDRAQVEDHYERAAFLIFSSLRDSFGAQVLEAARHSVPALLLSHQSAAGVVPRDACAVVKTSPLSSLSKRAAARLAAELVDDIGLTSRRQHARAFAVANTWQQRARTATDVYRSML